VFVRVSPYFRRSYAIAGNNCRRTIHRFDSANSASICDVFFANPRYRRRDNVELSRLMRPAVAKAAATVTECPMSATTEMRLSQVGDH
jgi:hypothetical protein